MTIGIYVRPWNEKFYRKLTKIAFPKDRNITFSEFKKNGEIWIGKALYDDDIYYNKFFCDSDMFNIYIRCRFLRSLPIELAYNFINKMAYFLNNLFDIYKFRIIIGHLVDNYTLDILERISKIRGAKYISIVPHFINGYARFTARGEFNYLNREIKEEEINKVLKVLNNNYYSPKFDLNKEKTYIQGVYNFYREYFKSRVYFKMMKTIMHDRYNYHYNTISFNKKKLSSIINRDLGKIFKKIKDIKFIDKSIYLPLHFTPEATVDYWCEDPLLTLYEDSIIQLISKSSKQFQLIIKEHPAMFMKRDINFYKKLLNFSNVYLVHPYENSNNIICKSKYIYVYTGSVGIEALLRGKVVISRTKNYYSGIHPNIVIKKYIEDDFNINPINFDEKIFIKKLLQGLFPANFINNKKILDSDIKKICKYLTLFLQTA